LFKPFSTDNRDDLFLAQWWFRTVALHVHLGQVSTSIATADLVKKRVQKLTKWSLHSRRSSQLRRASHRTGWTVVMRRQLVAGKVNEFGPLNE
jgi:hypothetical protein